MMKTETPMKPIPKAMIDTLPDYAAWYNQGNEINFTTHWDHLDDKMEGCGGCFATMLLPTLHDAWGVVPVWHEYQDGYGPGYVGDDWSGIRDSSPRSVAIMWNSMLENRGR